MTKLEQRLIAHRRRKARLEALQKMTQKLLKIVLPLIMVPAFVIYAVAFTHSLSLFTDDTFKNFFVPKDKKMMTAMAPVQFEPVVELYIEGDDRLPVPATASYRAVLRENGSEVSEFWQDWYLEQPVEGVFLDSDTGLLSVSETATAVEITIWVDVAGYSAAKTITLVRETEEEAEPGEPDGETPEPGEPGDDTGGETPEPGEPGDDTGGEIPEPEESGDDTGRETPDPGEPSGNAGDAGGDNGTGGGDAPGTDGDNDTGNEEQPADNGGEIPPESQTPSLA